MESERRTGRTTAIMATALADLLNTGNATFYDHREKSHDALRCLINVFKERLNGFMGFKHDDKYKFVIKGTQVEVTANKKHPFYEMYQDANRYVVAVDKKPDQVKWEDFVGWNDFAVPPVPEKHVEIMDEYGNIGVGPPIYNHKKWTGVYGECGFSVCQSVNEAITGKIIKWRPLQEKHD